MFYSVGIIFKTKKKIWREPLNKNSSEKVKRGENWCEVYESMKGTESGEILQEGGGGGGGGVLAVSAGYYAVISSRQKRQEGRLLQPHQTVKREITVEDRCQCEDIPDLSPESSLKHLNPKTNRVQQGPGIQTRKVESLSVWGGGRRSMAAKIRKHSRSLANCWLFCCGIVSVSQPLSLSLQLILSRSLNYWQDIDGIFIQQIQFTCKIA